MEANHLGGAVAQGRYLQHVHRTGLRSGHSSAGGQRHQRHRQRGKLLRPRIAAAVTDAEDKVVKQMEPEVLHSLPVSGRTWTWWWRG